MQAAKEGSDDDRSYWAKERSFSMLCTSAGERYSNTLGQHSLRPILVSV